MINFYLFPFFQEQSNWKGFQSLFLQSISTELVVDFFYSEVKKMNCNYPEKINSARDHQSDYGKGELEAKKSKNPRAIGS
jgi:hypothetical protein